MSPMRRVGARSLRMIATARFIYVEDDTAEDPRLTSKERHQTGHSNEEEFGGRNPYAPCAAVSWNFFSASSNSGSDRSSSTTASRASCTPG